MTRIATVARAALAAAALIGGTLVTGATTASADPLPVGTFKIQTNSLRCVEIGGADLPYQAFIENCGTLNLNQQFTYNPLTKQIASVGRLGYCLDADEFEGVKFIACDPNSVLQRFESQPRSFGRSTITTEDDPFLGFSYLSDGGVTLSLTSGNSGFSDANFFRFPLI
ncbi:hypothetical protein DW322_08000 [Rhodococcus rhodnii]|uniref:Uncharacterized protein n=2 Tax=Rhodococcus rhodnii TaxID=38312 RepID=R7WKD3_9NOCA|nr:RICIN domain-containing protein [Rhodococcus rhodnii]EOM75745.1 hypothetical protein Rrhod_2911 [Rhodococcus rhodnii LMG 5362]TXG90172.1 hypothetical protein DW322_08000 [Rhodococcus rhodnii]